jgi:hypothetical protein
MRQMPGHLHQYFVPRGCAVCIVASSIRTLNLSVPSKRKNLVVFMSSTQATSSTSNLQLIIDALADYA